MAVFLTVLVFPSYPGAPTVDRQISPHPTADLPAPRSTVNPELATSGGFWGTPDQGPSGPQSANGTGSYRVFGSASVGTEPQALTYDPDSGLTYVLNTGTDTVSVLNGTAPLARLDVGDYPVDAVFDDADGYVYVVSQVSVSPTSLGTVSILDGVRVVANLTVGLFPEAAIFNPTNDGVYIINWGSSNVTVIRGSEILASIPVTTSPLWTAYNPTYGDVYVASSANSTTCSGNVSVLNDLNLTATVATPKITGSGAYNSALGVVEFPTAYNITILNGTKLAGNLGSWVSPGCDASGEASTNGATSAQYDPQNGWLYVAANQTVYAFNGTSGLGRIANTFATELYYFPAAGRVVGIVESASGDTLEIYLGTTLGESLQLPGSSYWAAIQSTYENDRPMLDLLTGTPSGNGAVTFVAFSYVVDFVEAGLPSNSTWEVTLPFIANLSSSPDVGFFLPNGSYPAQLHAEPGYRSSGGVNVSVTGANEKVAVPFAQVTYPLFFEAFDGSVPLSGVAWSVIVGGGNFSSRGPYLNLTEPNGTYAWVLIASPGYSAPSNGSVTVNGAPGYVFLDFTRVTYPVTITEYGLPNGFTWKVLVGSTLESSKGLQVTIYEPNGSYSYSVEPVDGYRSNSSGSFSVDGSGVEVAIVFQSMPYTVTFAEQGLPTGTEWGVVIGGSSPYSSVGTSLNISEPRGSYTYTVDPVPGFSVVPPGTFTVANQGVRINSTFSVFRFAVAFVENGLPNGEAWSITVGGFPLVVAGPGTALEEPNGTYRFEVRAVPGYTVEPTDGTLTVAGESTTIRIEFVRPPTARIGLAQWFESTEGTSILVVCFASVAVTVATMVASCRKRSRSTEAERRRPPQD